MPESVGYWYVSAEERIPAAVRLPSPIRGSIHGGVGRLP